MLYIDGLVVSQVVTVIVLSTGVENNIANRGELQGSGIYQASYLLYQKGGKA